MALMASLVGAEGASARLSPTYQGVPGFASGAAESACAPWSAVLQFVLHLPAHAGGRFNGETAFAVRHPYPCPTSHARGTPRGAPRRGGPARNAGTDRLPG